MYQIRSETLQNHTWSELLMSTSLVQLILAPVFVTRIATIAAHRITHATLKGLSVVISVGDSSPRACGRRITGAIRGWQGPSHWHMLAKGEMVVVVAAPEQWNAAHVLFHSSAKEQFVTWLFLWSLLSLTLSSSVKSLLLQPSVDNCTSKNLRGEIWFMLVAVGW